MTDTKQKGNSVDDESSLSSPFDDLLVELSAEQQEMAYEFACETRKFEIELYWKRAAYFWGFLIVAFAGYGVALKEFGFENTYTFIIALVGFGFSLAWYFANRGSKFWQENWEHHIKILEDKIAGPIYKSHIDMAHFKFLEFWTPYPFSISKLNQMVSLYITAMWMFLVIRSVAGTLYLTEPIRGFNFIVSGMITLGFIILLVMCCKSSDGRKKTSSSESR